MSVIDLDPSPISVAIAPASEPANPTTQTTASFSFSTGDQVATVACGLDGGSLGPCTTWSTEQYGSLSPGSHTFTVQATDAAGNATSSSYTGRSRRRPRTRSRRRSRAPRPWEPR